MADKKPKRIRLYSTLSCPYCKMEHAWLDSKKVPHELVFVDLNQQEAMRMVEKTKQMGVPVTEIQYDDSDPQYIVGFDTAKLSSALGVA